MLRSSHKGSSSGALTLRLGLNGYSVSAGNLREDVWQLWPTETSPEHGFETRLNALKLTDIATHKMLDVVLNSALARIQVVRFPAGVRSPREQAAFLKAAFRNVYGREASDWHIAAERSYVNESTPAVAVDEKLMAALRELAERHQLKLRSVRTNFMDCFNDVRRSLLAHVGAFALIEDDRVCVGLWRHRAWVTISTQAFVSSNDSGSESNGEALAALCTQMLARVEPPMTHGTLYVVGTDKPFVVTLDEGWSVQWLDAERDPAHVGGARSKAA